MKKTSHKNTDIRKQEIIQSVSKIILTKGSEHVTVRSIAKIVNISEAAIYRHFKNKIEIFFFLTDFIKNMLINDFKKNNNINFTDLNSIVLFFKSHIENIEKRKGITFLILAEIISLGDQKLNNKVSKIVSEYISEVNKIITLGTEMKILNKDKISEDIGFAIYGIINGVTSKWILDNYNFNISQKLSSLLEIFLKSLT